MRAPGKDRVPHRLNEAGRRVLTPEGVKRAGERPLDPALVASCRLHHSLTFRHTSLIVNGLYQV